MNRKIRLLPEKIKEIKKLHDAGNSIGKTAKISGVSFGAVYSHVRLPERGFSNSKYRRYLHKDNVHNSYDPKYTKNMLERMGISEKKYRDILANRIGFESINDYKKYRISVNRNKYINKKFGRLLRKRLIELNKNIGWLAQELNIDKSNICRYTNGITLPKAHNQEKLFQLLELPYKTIDDILDGDFVSVDSLINHK